MLLLLGNNGEIDFQFVLWLKFSLVEHVIWLLGICGNYCTLCLARYELITLVKINAEGNKDSFRGLIFSGEYYFYEALK